MFESSERLEGDIAQILEAISTATEARYACIVEPTGIRFESEPGWPGRLFLEARLPRLFVLPGSLEGAGPEQDVFEGWEEDEVLIAFLNRRIALVAFCPDAEGARTVAERPFAALADRLLRWRPALRVDPQGGGLFFGRPRVDWVVVGAFRPGAG